MSSTQKKPETITGGCLCGSVRYTVKFPADHDFQANCATCQCSQCRKNSGSLYLHEQRVPVSAVTFTASATLRTYGATPGIARAFCSACGGFLYWRDEATPHIGLAVGAFDRDALAEFGPQLTTARTHLWCEAEIPGVTDHLTGSKWREDRTGNEADLLGD